MQVKHLIGLSEGERRAELEHAAASAMDALLAEIGRREAVTLVPMNRAQQLEFVVQWLGVEDCERAAPAAPPTLPPRDKLLAFLRQCRCDPTFRQMCHTRTSLRGGVVVVVIKSDLVDYY